MGTERRHGLMATYTLETGKNTKDMEKEPWRGLMGANTLATGKKTKWMGKEL